MRAVFKMKWGASMVGWRDEYSVGIPLIDEQHKNMFKMCNELIEILKNEKEVSFESIVGIIVELKKYTKYHFEQEELLMAKYQYSDIEEHKREHTKFVAELDNIKFGDIETEQLRVVKELVNHTTSWIIKHILSSDFKYSELISKSLDGGKMLDR